MNHVSQHQAIAHDLVLVSPFLLESVFDLEQVSEVAGGIDADLEVHRLALVIEDPQLLVEAVGHVPLADNRQLGVDVDRAGARHQEEAGLKVLQVVS
jgi:hypothetical protein